MENMSRALCALVVEDDRSWQQIFSEMLTDAGLTVDTAASLEAALPLIRERAHRLALVDLSLGGSDHHNQDGLRVLQALRQHDPACVTLLVSGFATVEIAVSALKEHGAFTCLRKETFNRAEFATLIRRALASSPTPAPPATQGAAPVAPLTAATSVLLVEDDAGWRSILVELLQEAGHQVRACGGFGEALGCLRRETFRLAVIDLALARGSAPSDNRDGMRLLVSSRAAGIPTIVVSGAATPEEVETAYAEHGIYAYVEKQTFDRRAFKHLVAEALASIGATMHPPDDLTAREREVLGLLARGLTNKEMARELVITTNTVKRHLKSIFEKMDVHTRAAAAARAVQGRR
jgi:DNA-binding NarL/FixJ family response regulator